MIKANTFADVFVIPNRGLPWSLGTVLNAFASVLNVLAKAVGRVAADPNNSQECSDE